VVIPSNTPKQKTDFQAVVIIPKSKQHFKAVISIDKADISPYGTNVLQAQQSKRITM
jgi:hypothetical protein